MSREGHGKSGAWAAAQAAVVAAVTDGLDLDLRAMEPDVVPSRAVQLALSGAVIMADWIASGGCFPGIEDPWQVSVVVARDRARLAWEKLRISGGWRHLSITPEIDLMKQRFNQRARPVQELAIDTAWAMPAPGLLLVEAPMGEGKTELALAAAEVLAFRFGCDGVFLGMPTQATSDAIFDRSAAWADRVDPGVPLALLHGKRRFNSRWWELEEASRAADVHDTDEFGCLDNFGAASDGNSAGPVLSSWFFGPKLGLLMRSSAGTIDQLLYAATRTRHVMLRHLGLSGRVVILDEVHAYDVYMMQFLGEALRWLADAGVPVILLSATLPPPVRSDLAEAYLQGAVRRRAVEIPESWNRDAGYPVVRALTVESGTASAASHATQGWRESIPVALEVLDESATALDDLAELLAGKLVGGGCVLVVRNTVARAQDTFTHLAARFGDVMPVTLLHSSIVMGDRADRTAEVLSLLGPGHDAAPRQPMIAVATQLAEQSFDVDADLLVTDLAPIDLLLQRIGRLHRHHRLHRPGAMRPATVIVTGLTRGSGAPGFPAGSEHVYCRYPLLRAAALAEETVADSGTWLVPMQVPELVRRGYSEEELGTESWQKDMESARVKFDEEKKRRAGNAEEFILSGEENLNRKDLSGLHNMRARDPEGDEDQVQALVRDGEDTVEVILVRRGDDGRYTLDGEWLGSADTRVSDPSITESLLRSSLRLPARFTKDAIKELRPLIESGGDPWLCRTRVLELDQDLRVVLGDRRLRYDTDLGLRDETHR
ncbi:CRISPR-associated helicase/endonuclease Cas3 [Actinoplanes sp. NBRC 101535]|nr:CRISPR-associated helicase/endonuclease Cas3 [Actinoplanes sp. NBRC 101535]